MEAILGARKAPLPLPVPIVTAPDIMPLPPKVPAFTFTVPFPVADPLLLLAISTPALTVDPPFWVLAPVRVSVPVPALMRVPASCITPEKVVLRLLLPTLKV